MTGLRRNEDMKIFGAWETSPSLSVPSLAIPEASRNCEQGLVAGSKGRS